jgi:hypothetical protein
VGGFREKIFFLKKGGCQTLGRKRVRVDKIFKWDMN